MLEPFPYQRHDVNASLRANATGFMVAETGAGKTLTGTQIGIESGLDTKLVIALKGTHRLVWKETIQKQDPNAVVRVLEGSEAGQDAYADLELGVPGWYLTTPQTFTRWKGMKTIRPDFTLVDEAHMLANRDGKGGILLRQFAKQTGHRMAMSGTLVRNDFENFWNLARFVYPERSAPGDIADISFQRWMSNFCETEYDHFAPGNRRVIGEAEPGHYASLLPLYLQHFKRAQCCEFHPEGFLEGLPAPIEIKHEVELTTAQKRMIRQMEEDWIAWLGEHPTVAKLPLIARMRIRQMTLGEPSVIPPATEDEKEYVYYDSECVSPKMDMIMEEILTEEPLIISTTSQKFAAAKVAYLNHRGIKAFEWSGQKTAKQRDEAMIEFERGGYRVIVGQSQAISTGLDGFQHVANELVSLDEDDDLSMGIQLEGRLDRRGQTRQVVHHKMVAKDSLDEGIIGSHLERRLKLNRSLRKQVAA